MNANLDNIGDINAPIWMNPELSLIDIYSYFILFDKDDYRLVTIEWFTRFKCNDPQMTFVNSFSKSNKKWINPLSYQRKFLNFQNCLITLDTDFDDSFGVNLFYGTITGLVPELFHIMSTKGKFIPNFQVHYIHGPDTSNGQIIYPNIYMRLGSYSKFTTGLVHFGSAFIPSEYPFYVTPGDLYSSYEKLLLPFDDTTWYYILTVFFVAFFVIFIVNLMPRKFSKYLFGSNVTTPALNVVEAFFGFGQTQEPIEISARIILVYFAFFCLVIRTAYQGVSFDFLTSEMRKKPIESIEKLVNHNYTIVTMEGSGKAFNEYIYSMIDENRR